ncbi:hypothetical protein N7468_002392 [Penicillium chermesinum]|uniref:CENP-V/GFA domain-containing protein n=1 Tax=Penicillium chermesinum TaxID=63820 RepID=A0A9W9PIN5_9EURO|nr:uncharacterized protein N7468_002392 [Penicillium chermesinum]KAJ5247409.1 hypothetical protein N7468_002392 [Penicillium chermesinum]
MPAGSCFCKNVRVEYDGEPIVTALCHCIDCRKLTGGLYSYNFLVNTADLRITGNPKAVPKSADSGNSIKNYFCPDCGTPLYGHKLTSSGEPDEATVLRAGILDDVDVIQQQIPGVELYTARRICWVKPFEEAIQSEGMLPAR